MNPARPATLNPAYQLPTGGIYVLTPRLSGMVIMRAENAYRKDKRRFPLWSTRVMKSYAHCHHHEIMPSSVLTIKKFSFATFFARSIRDSGQLKPCRALHSNLG